jgi:Caspase domain/Domain of unknown function (DUF4384)
MTTPKALRSSVGPAVAVALFAALCGALSGSGRAQTAQAPSTNGVKVSPLAQMTNGRQASGNNQILTTGIRGLPVATNHALIITVSGYAKSPLPGVALDRNIAIELAQRLGVPHENIVELSEEQVTREGLRQALADMNERMRPGDKLFVYFSGHGARFFSKDTGQCTESIVMQNMRVVTNKEFSDLLKPLSAKADKTIVMLDSCHSGGVAQAASARDLVMGKQRPKYSPEASSPECSVAANIGSFSQDRGIDLDTTDNNLVLIAAARKNEVAWDTSRGGALTYNFEQCLNGGAVDTDHSGSISVAEMVACVQGRVDKAQDESERQHITLAGNSALVPVFSDTPVTSIVGTAPVDTLAAIMDIYQQRDDRWNVNVTVGQPKLKIGSNLGLTVRSDRAGFVYIFYRGSQPDSFYLLFPNQLDASNAIAANQELQLPRPAWSVTALGPTGVDHLMVMITESPRDFSTLSLPAEYVSQAGAFDKIRPTSQAVSKIGQLATLSAAAGKAGCNDAAGTRDLGVARSCSSAFGAGLVSVEETN